MSDESDANIFQAFFPNNGILTMPCQVQDYWLRWPAHLELVKAIATKDKTLLSSALDTAGDVCNPTMGSGGDG